MTGRTEADRDTDHPMAELRDLGLLWLINRVVFHPRGFALAFYVEGDGTVRRWTLLGDGTEPWTMGDAPEDDLFATVEAFLDGLRPPEHRRKREEPEQAEPDAPETPAGRVTTPIGVKCPIDGTDVSQTTWEEVTPAGVEHHHPEPVCEQGHTAQVAFDAGGFSQPIKAMPGARDVPAEPGVDTSRPDDHGMLS